LILIPDCHKMSLLSAPPTSVVSQGTSADSSGNVVINVVVQAPQRVNDPLDSFNQSFRKPTVKFLAWLLILLATTSIAVQIAVSVMGFHGRNDWSPIGQGYWAGILFIYDARCVIRIAKDNTPTLSSVKNLYASLVVSSLVAVAMTWLSIQAAINSWRDSLISLYITLSVLGGLSLIVICIMCCCICTVGCCCCGVSETPKPQNDIDAQTRQQLTRIVRSAVAASEDQRTDTAWNQPPPYPNLSSKADP